MTPAATTSPTPIVRVQGLTKHFAVGRALLPKQAQILRAVEGVGFTIGAGEVLGLVGESGCGKSTVGRMLICLLDPTSGTIEFRGENLLGMPKEDLRRARRDMAIIFQDPYGSLNPRMTVESIVAEPIDVHEDVVGQARRNRVRDLLERVGLSARHLHRYPHEFSGGQRQRIGIARALALNPRFVICDEPVSALDVSIQAQVINLLQDLRREFDLSYLFIAHDLAVVKHISDRVAVMYLGRIVEVGAKKQLFANPLHPYTQALLAAIPEPRPRSSRRRPAITGEIPSALNPPSGCKFHTRCPHVMPVCCECEPRMTPAGAGQHVACHLYPDASGQGVAAG